MVHHHQAVLKYEFKKIKQGISPNFLYIYINLKILEDYNQDNLQMSSNIVIDDQLLIKVNRVKSMDPEYSPTPEGIHQGKISMFQN